MIQTPLHIKLPIVQKGALRFSQHCKPFSVPFESRERQESALSASDIFSLTLTLDSQGCRGLSPAMNAGPALFTQNYADNAEQFSKRFNILQMEDGFGLSDVILENTF